ncbi:MAG: UDP-N-acetylglucosamine 2-epimerase, partial [Candidatus Thorarchaeota archaeon]
MAIRHFLLPLMNRATYCRCLALIDAFEVDPEVRLTVLVGASLVESEYGEGVDYIRENHIGARVDELPSNCYSQSKGKSSKIASDIAKHFSDYLEDKEYDGIIIVGDRYEMLPLAMVSAYMNFITIHMQGGETTGSVDE